MRGREEGEEEDEGLVEDGGTQNEMKGMLQNGFE